MTSLDICATVARPGRAPDAVGSLHAGLTCRDNQSVSLLQNALK